MSNAFIDKLQAAFPPRRIVALLTSIALVPLAASFTDWLTTHFPGIHVSEAGVLGLMGVAVLAVVTFAYKEIDHLQAREPLPGHFEQALKEVEDDPEVQAAFAALGTLHGVKDLLTELRAHVENENVDRSQLSAQLGAILDELALPTPVAGPTPGANGGISASEPFATGTVIETGWPFGRRPVSVSLTSLLCVTAFGLG